MATKLNLCIDKNIDFRQEILLTDNNGDDLTFTANDAANATMRKAHSSSNVFIFTTILSNGSIVIGCNTTALANMSPGRYIWDIVLDKDDSVSKVVEGIALVKPTSSEV